MHFFDLVADDLADTLEHFIVPDQTYHEAEATVEIWLPDSEDAHSGINEPVDERNYD